MKLGSELLRGPPPPVISAIFQLPPSPASASCSSSSPLRSFPLPAHLRTLRTLRTLRSCSRPNLKIRRAIGGCGMKIEFVADMSSEIEFSNFAIELCQMHTLPPALTLEAAANQIKEAICELKSTPPAASGVLRFQVAVPASIKALNWLNCQNNSLEVFPQLYLSGDQLEKTTHGSTSLERTHAVSAIGSAVHFMGASDDLKAYDLIRRYLSVDSPLIKAYGFVGINSDSEFAMMHENGSFYVFIPQIELDEFENNSMLAATLVWDESSFTFKKAVDYFELSFHQATYRVWPAHEFFPGNWITCIQEKSYLEDQNVQMVCLNAHSFAQDTNADYLEMEKATISLPFHFRLSARTAFTNDMFDGSLGMANVLKKCANINSVWAALIIEECTRLGLTYFCIAPGSRSSPLAIAASVHPRTTCISCYDERSLGFHALGYARGCNEPAVVITSSGTAISNLLPAIVEASQDFVPMLLLTADRPPELLDAGANQAINQVNHYGSFVRFFFSLPPPSDNVPARMVLTTLDSAVYKATQTPCGPAHINCQFREPLDDSPRDWSWNCLKGLNLWTPKTEPFTKYIRLQNFCASTDIRGQIGEILDIIQNAKQGLLVVGQICTEEDIWATFFLAKHLFWPVVADILSGLRFRKVVTSFPEVEKNFLFLDHLDHVLLSELARSWIKPDVVVQIGSRITSKRVAQMLEDCLPHSYIMVDKHPCRHDPSHIVTYRLQSTITEFVDFVLKVKFPRNISGWHTFLQAVNLMVQWELGFQIHSESSLTEPYIAQVISEVIHRGTTLFIGNSMVIRDADMYGNGWVCPGANVSPSMSSWGLSSCGVRVAANRGASGIDGLLSTAIGFAVGSKKRVLCVVGDISFLHDTNGLAILSQRISRKPMTILVINNRGGAIFSLLPIADRTHPSILKQYFYTSHNISFSKLCEAHSLQYTQVCTKEELKISLQMSLHSETDYIIEIQSGIKENAIFHRHLTKSARQAADDALRILSRFSISDKFFHVPYLCKIHKMEFSLYRIQLYAQRTSTPADRHCDIIYKDGFVLTMFLEDRSVGFGEVAPIEVHKEDLTDVEEQLKFLVHKIQGAKLSYHLPLLKGSFSSWIWKHLGILPSSIFPSVRCGLEMAILNALATRLGISLSGVILGNGTSSVDQFIEDEISKRPSGVQICALVDSSGTPKEIAQVVAQLVDEGFTTIKLKVARRASPVEDANVIREIRQKVGYKIKLRVDANRKWTYKQAILFGSYVTCYNLEYIEEPVCSEDDILTFCEETGLPVALDETIDNIQGDPLHKLMAYVHTGIVAVVIKPSVVGGFENAALIAKWAQQYEKMAVVSSAFESSLSLSAYVQFSYYLEQRNKESCMLKSKESYPTIAHGLGTYRWLKEDLTTEPHKFTVHPQGNGVEASVEDAAMLLQYFRINPNVVQRTYSEQQVCTYQWKVNWEGFSCSFNVQDVGGSKFDTKAAVFLHGFLGTCEDWVPIMKSLSLNMRCISIDLPGHGKSIITRHPDTSEQELRMSIEVVADMLSKLINDISPGRVVLIGYSLGARIALYMLLRCNQQIDGAVMISGSPGLRDDMQRNIRAAQDDEKAQYLAAYGVQCFLDRWYTGQLWSSLREHPHFEQIIGSRMQHNDVCSLAKVLSGLSPGRQPSLWEDLSGCNKPLLFIYGQKDNKFREIAQQMASAVSPGLETDGNCGQPDKVIEIPDCGHAVHLENPLPLINFLRKFLNRME